ncbi:SOS response-associated peptidase [Rhizobium sp. YTU87027]|uniref:SOS response-associated peptidase n=1 Tax=Rhizobium sp. YTU87027 TaxID=3417741 RepID=UPI003D68B406
MCNLYRMDDRDWVNKWAQDAESLINPMPAYQINPDQWAPVIRNTSDGTRQLANCRWGLPSPPYMQRKAAEARAEKLRKKGLPVDIGELLRMEPDGGVTNIRNLTLPHWKRWFGVEHRCLVPVTTFAEPDPASKDEGGKTPNAWFSAGPENIAHLAVLSISTAWSTSNEFVFLTKSLSFLKRTILAKRENFRSAFLGSILTCRTVHGG